MVTKLVNELNQFKQLIFQPKLSTQNFYSILNYYQKILIIHISHLLVLQFIHLQKEFLTVIVISISGLHRQIHKPICFTFKNRGSNIHYKKEIRTSSKSKGVLYLIYTILFRPSLTFRIALNSIKVLAKTKFAVVYFLLVYSYIVLNKYYSIE